MLCGSEAIKYVTPEHLKLTEELSFKFYFILMNLNLNSYTWLVAIILDSTEYRRFLLSQQVLLNSGGVSECSFSLRVIKLQLIDL